MAGVPADLPAVGDVCGRIEISQFEIRPVTQPRPFAALTCGEALPSRGIEILRDRLGGAGHRRLADPGIELLCGIDAEYVTLARPAQHHLDVTNAVDAV